MGMFGALVGAAIDRTDGDSGIKGALIGGAISNTVKVLFPLAVTFAIGLTVQQIAKVSWRKLADRPE